MATKKITAKLKKQDGGYYFPELDIHVIAKTQQGAKAAVKNYYGFDPDERVAELKKADKPKAKK